MYRYSSCALFILSTSATKGFSLLTHTTQLQSYQSRQAIVIIYHDTLI